MAKYQRYEEYKDVQNEWVSSVPSDWKVVPLKALCLNPVKDGPHETPIFIDEGIPFLSVDGIQNNQLVFEGCRYISEQDHQKYSRKCAPAKGDVLLGKAASVGKVAYVDADIDFNVWSPLAVITPKTTSLSKYIFYAFQSTMLQAQCEVYSNSNTQKNLGMNAIDNLHLPFPSYKEAEIIADFLDHETAQIDMLIEKQQTLIQLLKEKRQAVISHAVTKGINPDASMKDSGVEWLGSVPEHWDISLIKHKCSEITDGAHISPDLVDGKHFFVSIRDIKEGVINFDDALLTSAKSYDYLLRTGCKPFEGDILFSKDGTIGQTAITPSNKDFVVASSLIIIRPNRQKVIPEYLDLLLQSPLVKEQTESFVKGAALRRLSIQNLLKVIGVFPLIEEQLSIVEFVQKQLKLYKKLENEATKAIQLMQERRTALISAAVTGKIDVRGWQAPN